MLEIINIEFPTIHGQAARREGPGHGVLGGGLITARGWKTHQSGGNIHLIIEVMVHCVLNILGDFVLKHLALSGFTAIMAWQAASKGYCIGK